MITYAKVSIKGTETIEVFLLTDTAGKCRSRNLGHPDFPNMTVYRLNTGLEN